MKKTLIALAAVAATGAAFAQSSVTLSGAVAYGYQSIKSGATNTTAKGFGLDDAALTFVATEDLGGGLKATAKIGLGDPIGKGDAVLGTDTTLTLSGGFGTLFMGQIKIGSGIRGNAQAGAPVNNMEGEVLDPATNGSDIVRYTTPAMGGATFDIALVEGKNIATGLSAGQSSSISAGVSYSAGPLKARFDMTNWDSDSAKYDSRYRISAQYDLGVAKVGAGFENIKNVAALGGRTKFTMLGVSAPVGAMTVGAAWVKKDVSNVAGDLTGWTIGASYALSKRTSIDANYAVYDSSYAATTNDKKTTILLVHSF